MFTPAGSGLRAKPLGLPHLAGSAAGFVLLGLLVYFPALSGGLIWDDHYLVGENPFFRSPVFVWEVFSHYLFNDTFSIYYRPVQNWSYLADYWIWGGDPFGYHLTNIVLHSLAGWLLFVLMRELLGPILRGTPSRRTDWMAGAVALLWTVHPIHNAAVAYIAGRADSLAAVFCLGAWWVWLSGSRVPGASGLQRLLRWGAAAVLLLLALCSKEIAFAWLGLFCFYHLFFDPARTWRATLGVLAGIAVVVGIYLLLHALPQARLPMKPAAQPWATRLLHMLQALGEYVGLIFYPARLTMDRTLGFPSPFFALGDSRVLRAMLCLGAFGFLALCKGPGRRLRLFGLGWFWIGFLPISNLFPLNAEVAEHWIYLASIGFLLLLAGTVMLLGIRLQRLAVGLGMLVLLGLGARTWSRSQDWVDEERFLKSTLSSGGISPRVLTNLAALYGNRGDYPQQEQLLRRTLGLFPENAAACINLGISLRKQGRLEEAEPYFAYDEKHTREMAQGLGSSWNAAVNLALVKKAGGHLEEALEIIHTARERFPEVWPLVGFETELTKELRGVAAATLVTEKFATEHWWHRQAWLSLGALRGQNQQLPEAIAALENASRLDMHDAKALKQKAFFELELQDVAGAYRTQKSVLERAPAEPSGYLVMAEILTRLNRGSEAEAARQRAQVLTLEARQLLPEASGQAH
jgi:protein O-mannosyl-transferase